MSTLDILKHQKKWRGSQATTPNKSNAGTGVVNEVEDEENGDIWLTQCRSDWARLKSIKDHAERNTHKPAALLNYQEYLREWISGENTEQNDVLGMNIIWALDSGHFEWLFEMADYAIKTKQANTLMQRDFATLIADTIIQAHEPLFKDDDKSLDHVLHFLIQRIELSEWVFNPHDIIRARAYRMGGLVAQRDEDWSEALSYYTKANDLKGDIGVKGRITEMQSRVDNAVKTAPQPPPDSSVAESVNLNSTGKSTDDSSGGFNSGE